jgi:beta-1,2-mannobiose phosphorylase / 1,2-beta-oligomannan phosphorylase
LTRAPDPPPVPPARAPGNPLLTPADVSPSRPDFEVIGVFNPAVLVEDGETSLLLRVAERPRDIPLDEVSAPFYDPVAGRIVVRRWRRGAPGVRAEDPRVVLVHGEAWLTSISHLRWARSRDGLRFEVDAEPALVASGETDAFGVEDARATRLGGEWWINYTAVSPWGIATAAAVTRDRRRLERRGIWFSPPNRDVTPFPEKIDGRYAALHRPMPEGIGSSAIWFASSPDLQAWGSHHPVAAARPAAWDGAKVGGGAPPFRVRDGWLALYHGVDAASRYSLGALLLDPREPWRVIGRSSEPVLAPEAPYEREGFFGNVVFTCGAAVDGDRIRVYYGAADTVVAAADLSLDAILGGLA